MQPVSTDSDTYRNTPPKNVHLASVEDGERLTAHSSFMAV
jgi:hypothetical protein